MSNEIMSLNKFLSSFQKYVEEIGGDLETTIAAHEISPDLNVIYEDEQGESHYFDITRLDLSFMFGCMCPDGISIIIKKRED